MLSSCPTREKIQIPHPSLPLFVAGKHEATRLQLQDTEDFSQARFMESWESKHSDQSFSSKLAKELGVTAAPLRLDSQAKYGKHQHSADMPQRVRVFTSVCTKP